MTTMWQGIDWPLAIGLALVFLVTSVLRWRYFRSAARRWGNRPRDGTKSP